MNPEAQELLKTILAKHVSAITSGDLKFLRARRSYLTPEQIETYYLDEENIVVDVEKVEEIKEDLITDAGKKVEESAMDIDVPTKVEEVKPDLSGMSYADLKSEAKALGLKYTAVSRENLIKSITAKLTQVNSK